MKKPSRVFLSGPMTGIEDFNYPAFNALAAKIRAAGFTVLNPAENPKCETWSEYMKLAIAQLLMCDTVVQLPGWSESRGASCEFRIAKDCDLQIHSQAFFEDAFLSKPEAPKQMPEWICHKRVRAAKIRSMVQTDVNAGGFLILDNGMNAKVDYGWLKKHCPKLGGYYVEYKDGYHSYSPAEAFEEGYSPAPNMRPLTADELEFKTLMEGTQLTEEQKAAIRMQDAMLPEHRIQWDPAFKNSFKAMTGVDIDAVHKERSSIPDEEMRAEGWVPIEEVNSITTSDPREEILKADVNGRQWCTRVTRSMSFPANPYPKGEGEKP